MADWFKFYENDLDETRLQYAIAKLPEVVSVWVGILSECCRHKSGTVSWCKDEIELFGFSRRLGVSMPKVNEGINLLLEIRYLVKTDDKLTVIKWGEKQSEYCQKLTKRQNQAGDQNPMRRDTVGTLSGQKPDSVGQEERRGEEIKGEEKENGSPPKFSETPSWEEFWAYCQSPHCGIAAEWYAKDKFWAACQDKWQKKSDWRAYARRVRGWWDNDGRPMKPVQNYGNKNTKKPNARNFGIAEDPAEAGRRTVANAAKRAAERAAERAGQKTT